MHFTIYYARSGLGLAKDAEILKRALVTLGHEVSLSEQPIPSQGFIGRLSKATVKFLKIAGVLFFFRRLQRLIFGKPSSAVIYLEKIFYGKLYQHKKHILIPNQEWFNPSAFVLLDYIDKVWTKTHLATGVFSEFGCRTQFISFSTSIGELSNFPRKSNYCFSRVGVSRLRGANKLLAAWEKHPEWPLLKLSIHPSCRPADCPENVEFLDFFESFQDYVNCASAALFHVYPTETEGFGHSIVEAMSYGSPVLVTDAPPMNELVNANCGILVPASYIGHKLFSPRFSVELSALETAIEKALMMDSQALQRLSENARARVVELENEFYQNLALAIKKL